MDIKISCIILNGDNSICIKIISVKIFGLQLLRRNSIVLTAVYFSRVGVLLAIWTGDKVNEGGIGGTNSTDGEDEKSIQNFSW
jgi:hypothetical protein